MKLKKRKDLKPDPIPKDNESYSKVTYYPIFTARNDDAINFSMRLFEIGSGGFSSKHKHSYEHEVYVIEGDGFLFMEGEKFAIEKDDCIYIEPYEYHQLEAGEKGISFVCLVPNREKTQPD